mmetsp:Transcript_41110/g.124481  ORF Transcript_41110/g.124481 Transcript_41110/m.124481 type:complete len:182 (-) Transcript_41110:27-572(-)
MADSSSSSSGSAGASRKRGRGTARTRGEESCCLICLQPYALGSGRKSDALNSCKVCHVVLHRDCYLQCVRKYIDDLLLEHVESRANGEERELVYSGPTCPHCRNTAGFSTWPRPRKIPLRLQLKEEERWVELLRAAMNRNESDEVEYDDPMARGLVVSALRNLLEQHEQKAAELREALKQS